MTVMLGIFPRLRNLIDLLYAGKRRVFFCTTDWPGRVECDLCGGQRPAVFLGRAGAAPACEYRCGPSAALKCDSGSASPWWKNRCRAGSGHRNSRTGRRVVQYKGKLAISLRIGFKKNSF